jgi:hypothetical protein
MLDKSTQQPWSQGLILSLTGMLLLFGLSVLGIMATVAIKKGNSVPFLRLFSVPLIVVAAVFLVIAGFNDAQIAPVVGLLGTIAGYLLGSEKAATQAASAAPAVPLPGKPGAVTWNAGTRMLTIAKLPPDAAKVRVFRKAAGGVVEVAGEAAALSFDLNSPTPLVAGTQYDAWVVGTNTTGDGPESGHITFTA